MRSLERINSRAFEGLTVLGSLRISSHSLLKAPELSTVGQSLRDLLLSNFEGEHDDIHLAPLVALTSLAMENAGLTRVPKDVHHVAATLNRLALSKNKITTLDNMYDIPFPHLRAVLLDVNNISHLNPSLLRLPELEHFSIQRNKLTQLPDLNLCVWGTTSDVVPYFILDNNPWNCNGSTTLLRKSLCESWGEIYYRRLMMVIVLENTYCQSPTEVKGRAVVNVEKLHSNNIDTCGEWLAYYYRLCVVFLW